MKRNPTEKGSFASRYGAKTGGFVPIGRRIALALPLSVCLLAGTALPPLSAQANTSSDPVNDDSWRDLEPRVTLTTGESPDNTVMIPTSRPDTSFLLAAAPQDMLLPQSRPDRDSIYQKTIVDFDEAYRQSFGFDPLASAQRLELRKNAGIAKVISRSGFSNAETRSAVKIIQSHRSLRKLPADFAVDVISPGKSRAVHPGAIRIALEDELDLSLYQAEDGSWNKQISLRPVERYLNYAYGEISTSLYQASIDVGVSDDVFNTFVQVLSFSVDFQREIRKGDQFEVLFEVKKDPISGKTNSNALYYLSMTLSGDRIEYFRHEHADGTIGWYDEVGNSAARTLMRTPVNGARLSSGYGTRKHPILGYSRLHQGADFAAPTGTPIMAAGSGVVEYSGRNGNYGKYVRIRHSPTYQTAYGHMSKIPKSIAVGARVQQGQTIGYVGSTGLSTGPHLHYEIMVNNKKTNPLTVELPVGDALPDEERTPFETSLASISNELTSRGILRFAEKQQ
jgi:murein DD-endopeptidase MepM/ murein hydrolase activator NlpD